jgi:hypothetical protein
MFCAPRLILGGTEGAASRFHVLCSRTHLVLYGGRQVSFSCFALLNSFWAVPRVSGLIFMFCANKHVFDGSEGVGSRFHVLCYRTLFRRCRGRQVLFSCVALSSSFSTVPRASGPFSCFALPDPFSTVSRTSGPVFMFYAPRLVLFGTDGVGSSFKVLRSRSHFRLFRGRGVPFSCFSLPNSFSTVPRASGPDFKFCAPGHVSGGTEGVESRFHVSRSRTHFRQYRGRRFLFSCFALPDSFWAVPRLSGPVFIFCAPDSFSTVPRASGLIFMFCAVGAFLGGPSASGSVFMFCASELVFCDAEVVRCCFHILRSRIHFGRNRGRRVLYSFFALPDFFGVVSRASGLFSYFALLN